MIAACPDCERLVVELLKLINEDGLKFTYVDRCILLSHLFAERMLHALRKGRELFGWGRDAAIDADAWQACFRRQLMWNGVDLMEMIHMLVEEFGMDKSDILRR
eukprot:3739581-Pleurochrysis_carterae.AAC.1